MKGLKQGALLQGGRYIIEKVLGQGGFGITYLGVQQALDAKVAIKEFFMKEHCNRDAETSQVTVGSVGSREMVERFRQKFIKEARNIYRLKHKHIIPVIDVFEENGTAYYVMEHLSGGSLSDKVKDGAIPEADAVRYISQVASALDLVHSKHMMHLDVKPANILLDESNEAVLIDFGLAKQYDETGNQTSTTPVGISHGYAPMEQYRRGGVGTFSPATDIYSLGATLYKLVTGNTPPEASDVNDDGLPALPQYLSANVRAAIEASMQPRRKDRPQSIGEFLEIVESGKSKDERAKSKDESGELRDDIVQGTNEGDSEVTFAFREKPSTSTIERSTEETHLAGAVISNDSEKSQFSGSCHPERSEGSYKHANREILPPSGRQNDNSGKMKDERAKSKDERKGLGGTSKKRWAIVVAILVIIGAGAMFMLGGGSNNYEGKLVPILDNSNDKYGYADTLGNVIIEPQYDFARSFSEGLAVVIKDDKYGFIDKTGKVVVEPKYDNAWLFSDGLAAVKKDGKYGFIDKTGKVVVEPQYDDVWEFSDGLARVVKDGKYGFIDKTGKVVIGLQYDDAWEFSEGLARVRKDDRRGFIDKTGKVVIGLQYDDAYYFSEGLALVEKDGKVFNIDKTGKVVVEPQYDYALEFSDGLAAVKKDGKYGFIDKTGKVVVEPQYDGVWEFSEGLAKVQKDGKVFYIDKTGREYIKW